MQINDLTGLFHHTLTDMYSAEQQITEALPKMIEKTTHEALREALEEHLEVTKNQIQRLTRVVDLMGWSFEVSKPCEGMKGILAEGEKTVGEISDTATRDAAIIGSAQRVEHYEIAVYGTLAEYAKQLEQDEAAELLGMNLEEEEEADQALSQIAEGGLFEAGVNKMADES